MNFLDEVSSSNINFFTSISFILFVNDREERDSIPDQVIPNTLKMILDVSLLDTQNL